jgi:hypothetical protein
LEPIHSRIAAGKQTIMEMLLLLTLFAPLRQYPFAFQKYRLGVIPALLPVIFSLLPTRAAKPAGFKFACASRQIGVF